MIGVVLFFFFFFLKFVIRIYFTGILEWVINLTGGLVGLRGFFLRFGQTYCQSLCSAIGLLQRK